MPPRLIALAIVSCFLPFLTGCFLTGTTWAEANATKLQSPKVVGVIWPGSDRSNEGIIIRYNLDSDWRGQLQPWVFFRVPVSGNSLADSSYCMDVSGRDVADFDQSVGGKMPESMPRARLDIVGPGGRLPGGMKGFLPVDPQEPNGVVYEGITSDPKPLHTIFLKERPDGSLVR